jgi:hypothetical protein
MNTISPAMTAISGAYGMPSSSAPMPTTEP